MVTCKLWAGAANQLFMISATICHALRMKTNYAIPRKTINPRVWKTYINHLPEVRPGYSTKSYFRQPGHSFTPIPDEQDITLEGYFQSEKYWYEYKEQLAQILGFQYKPVNYVAVHVRRGDYLQYPDRFPVLPFQYYENSIQCFIDKGHDSFKVYSDDIEWCKKTFINKGLHFSYSEKKDPISDIKDIFNANGYILANSTFGLFPALLRADYPITIVPQSDLWFGPKGQDMNSLDRLPERFTKL